MKRARAKKTGTAPSRKPVKAGTKTAKRAPRSAPEPGRTLVIVESPSKARTLGKILGKGYDIQSSVGHIRDLPKSRLAIDVDNGFEPEYILVRGKGAVVRNLKERASVSGRVLIASDPDREGEAIAWHLSETLGVDPGSPCRVSCLLYTSHLEHYIRLRRRDEPPAGRDQPGPPGGPFPRRVHRVQAGPARIPPSAPGGWVHPREPGQR